MASMAVHRNSTGRIVAGMLRENTGRALCDSGGIYGRNYERNQTREFAKEPRVSLDFAGGYIDASINVWHFLNSFAEYDAREDRRFRQFMDAKCREDDSYLSLMQAFAEKESEKCKQDGLTW